MTADRIGRREVESILGLSRAAVRKLVAANELATLRDERGVLWYSRAEVMDLRQRREAGQHDAPVLTDHLFELDKLRLRQQREAREEREVSAERDRQDRACETALHQTRVETLLDRISRNLSKLRQSSDDIASALNRLIWISLGQGALQALPDELRTKMWAALGQGSASATESAKSTWMTAEELDALRRNMNVSGSAQTNPAAR